MSETSNSAGAGFTATNAPTPTQITPNNGAGSDSPSPNFGGRFFDEIDSSSEPSAPVSKESAELLSDLAGDEVSEEGDDSSYLPPAKEVGKEVQEATSDSGDGGAAAPKVKTYKVISGGKAANLPLDAKFSIPVDGKTTEVSFNDLVQNYNGKVGWDKRYTELDKGRKQFSQEKASFESDKNALNGGLEQFFNLVQTKKGPQAWSHLIKMAGLDGKYSLADLRSEVLAQAKQLESMNPAQREAFEAREQAEYYKSEYERAQESQRARQVQAQAEAQLDQVLDSHSITREKYGEYHSQLSEGGIPQQDITPDVIIDYHKRLDAYTAIRQAAEKVDIKLLKDDKLVNRLRDFKLANPDFSASDIQDVLRSWKGDKRAKIVSDKVRQSKTATSASVRQSAPKQAPKAYDRDDHFF